MKSNKVNMHKEAENINKALKSFSSTAKGKNVSVTFAEGNRLVSVKEDGKKEYIGELKGKVRVSQRVFKL